MNIELSPEELEYICSALWKTPAPSTESEMKDIGSLYGKLVAAWYLSVQKMNSNLLTPKSIDGQPEPVAIPGAIPMSERSARSRLIPEREEAMEKAREMFSPPGSPESMFPTVKLSGCAVCGIGAGKVMGYVCPRSDCPMKVTSGGEV
jgi:hypothetical protein